MGAIFWLIAVFLSAAAGVSAGILIVRRGNKSEATRFTEVLKKIEKPAVAESLKNENWGKLAPLADELEKLLQTINEKEERRQKEINELIYGASHDLRTPLVTFQGFLKRLLQKYGDALNDEAKRYIERMQTSADKMEMIIHDMVALSRVMNPREEIQTASLGSLLASAWLEAKKFVGKEEGSIRFPDDLPEISCLPRTLSSAFEQVLINAITYVGEEQKPEIDVTYTATEQGFKLTFSDNGIGIEEKWLETIFLPFKRLHPYDRYPGTGLGLTVVKHAVESHKGKVVVESTSGQGTKVHLHISALDGDEVEKNADVESTQQ
jgi:signal transduction histidine kinase